MSSFWSVNPATGRRISQYHYLDAERIEAELTAAAHCFADSRCTPLSVRKERMLRVANLLEEHVESLAGLITAEMGKVRSEAHAEVEKCARVCRYYAEHAASMLDDEPVATEATTSFVRYEPLGPVLAVMPWNFPFWQVFRFAAPALMAGNVVLLKHASNVPGSALAIADLFVHAGFSPGSFSTLLIESRRVAAMAKNSMIAI